MKQGTIISIFFSGTVLMMLGLDFIFPFYYESQNDIVFSYPRNNLEIFFDFFVFAILLICSIGLLYKRKVFIYMYPIPVFFILYVALSFLLLKGRYGNYSEYQTKLIGLIMLVYSTLSIFLIVKKVFVEKNFTIDRKFITILFQVLGSIVLFAIWVIVAR